MPLCLERFLDSRTVIDFLESKLAKLSVSRFDFCSFGRTSFVSRLSVILLLDLLVPIVNIYTHLSRNHLVSSDSIRINIGFSGYSKMIVAIECTVVPLRTLNNPFDDLFNVSLTFSCFMTLYAGSRKFVRQ